jgi:hypothetical protein
VPYPTQQDLLGADPLLEWIDRHFLRNDPYAFQSSGFKDFALVCASALGVDPNGIYCLGSGAVGLSLNPNKMTGSTLKTFDASSDLDIALISEVHFEQAWRDLRSKSHPAAVGELEHDLADAMSHQRKRFFDGAILTNKLLPHLEFGNVWVSQLVRVSEMAAIALDREVDVNCWIYRDYWSVRSYVATGVMKCKEKV